ELADKATYQCLQFFGGYGYMEEYKVARAFRDSRIGTIGGGSSEIMREIIAKMVIDDVNYDRAESSQVESAPALETVSDIFATLPARFKAEKAKGKNLNVHFQFTNDMFTVNIQDGNLKVEKGLQGNADCLVETDDETYINVETGKMNPQEAFMTGKIKVSDLMQMMAFGGLFKKL
nr:acyl-CoA dehydrogenase family protein [Chitinophagales bacterium]